VRGPAPVRARFVPLKIGGYGGTGRDRADIKSSTMATIEGTQLREQIRRDRRGAGADSRRLDGRGRSAGCLLLAEPTGIVACSGLFIA